jgi:rhodanese-related sulfurtransferase
MNSVGQGIATTPLTMSRKPGVMEPEELKKFVEAAGDKLIVVDARNTDFAVEPGDKDTHVKGGIPGLAGGGGPARPRAVNAPYDREAKKLDLAKIPAEWIEAGGGKEAVPVITHCGGGGRGQKAKDFLLANGFKNVANGGGPEDDECWAIFGTK